VEEVKRIRARFSNGVFKPLESIEVELEEGEEVSIAISELPSTFKPEKIIKALRATSGGWRGLIDADKLKRDIYADRLISTRPEIEL